MKINYVVSALLKCIMTKPHQHTIYRQKAGFGDRFTFVLFIHKRKRHSRRRKCRKRVCSPVIVFFAVDASVFAEAGEFRLQVEFTLAALQTAHVPLLVHGEQVIAVRDLSSAARAQSHPVPTDRRHVLHKHRRTALIKGRNSKLSFIKTPYFCTIICSVIQMNISNVRLETHKIHNAYLKCLGSVVKTLFYAFADEKCPKNQALLVFTSVENGRGEIEKINTEVYSVSECTLICISYFP